MEELSYSSLAEQVQHFYLKTPERMGRPVTVIKQSKRNEWEASQRVRTAGVRNAGDVEAEILSKAENVKRPVTKKTPEAPSLLNLRSTAVLSQSKGNTKQRRKSAPGGGHSQLRPRPKTTEELELEALAKIPKFKALPLNRKIFESRGDLGVFRHKKREVTVPVEFKFATNARLKVQQRSDGFLDRYRRLSLDSRPPLGTGKTVVQPFHLLTEERGSIKMKKFMEELSKQLLEDSFARIPKAGLLPFTTELPTVHRRPEQKPCTKPEPFQLESMLRHEQEQNRLATERARAEKERAELSKFRAQPLQCSGPIFVPERSRKPLTEIKEFNFRADTRAVQRAEFEKKKTEKHSLYKKLKQELEAARKDEEERFVRALRKEMIPQARPMPLFDRPIAPQRSSKPLTVPVSPLLSLPRKHRPDGPFTFRKFRPK